ncbi:polyamine aminopropyltransferase [Thalassotalea sp. LPB0316]|uniref:polyamine aminopropyltransferase n=1 Tax=Thalassotalea sp. LPB0316 TaxID=2769490 RepID=UPI0018671E77|nr:polyamine aminopropyltransferase [Thalassotalea sp. LPB0316]QOL26928.1 polyamine aminopropyltransferase [Thalassotalea sp. LPB0316]
MSDTKKFFWDDSLLILTMALLAGCGLIYEYLLSHYAGRVLGVMESTIYTMIGLMIVAMGVGAFAARFVKCAFNGFLYLELIIAFLGTTAILTIGGLIAISQLLPHIIAETFALPPDAMPKGGWLKSLNWLAMKSPYFFGFLLGFFIGMEIPLIARVREIVHQKHLANNLGTMYGADYIGAGIGAAIWVTVLLTIDINEAAAITASINLLAGLMFMSRYWAMIKHKTLLLSGHILLSLLVLVVFNYGNQWLNQMSNLLYLDKVVYSDKTRYQQLTFTERRLGHNQDTVINFYLNGRLQFSSSDEFIYHGYLVEPALAGSARQDNILIIGGGDGLALRDVLRWQPKQVTLIDLDEKLMSLFRQPEQHLPKKLAGQIQALTQDSFADQRVEVIAADAFLAIDELLKQQRYYDAIIIDLPDPSHPDLNKLYSVNFYARINQLLSGDGLLAIQSTSPYHAKNAFIAIGNTVEAAGFLHVEQYHDNVPSFGEWGWTIAAKSGASPYQRLAALPQLPNNHLWLTKNLVLSAFEFPQNFYQDKDDIPVNYLGSHVIYQLHQQAWQSQQGLNNAHLQ